MTRRSNDGDKQSILYEFEFVNTKLLKKLLNANLTCLTLRNDFSIESFN